jgi:hypothetical protein
LKGLFSIFLNNTPVVIVSNTSTSG